MATNIEIEAKVLISETDYNKILNYYSKRGGNRIMQTNYYIDTDDLLLKSFGIGLRIREKGFYVLTMKAPLQEGLLEKKESITKEQVENLKLHGTFPSGGIKNLLMMYGINPSQLKIQTFLVTDRLEIENHDKGELLAIDKNIYNGIVDYELEMEGSSLDLATKELKRICEEIGINYIENSKSKQVRAMETIKKAS
ncbi:MAG: CYTH domain-containing protein [Candidatus Onthovivens sp.]|nr:CYTH domain-containing protein [Candidatus Onthovivens sp.]